MRLFKSNSNTPFAGHHPRAGPGTRSKLLSKMPVRTKNHVVAAAAEFVGTFLFLFFAFGGAQTANTAPGADDAAVARILYIALSFGISLLVNAWVFFRVSGGLFNPAVSLAMAIAGAIDLVRLAVVVPAQLLGGIAAASAVAWLLPGPLAVGTALAGDVSAARGLFLEILLTAELVLTIFMLAGEKHRGTFLAPVGIGLSLFIAHLAGVRHTGASLNPARSLGPAVVTGTFPGHHWIYWVGPALGSLLASFIYLLIKAVDYMTVNPAQDAAEAAADEQQQRPAAASRGASSGGGAHGAREGDDNHNNNGAGASGNKDGAFERSPGLEDGQGSRAGH